MIRKSFRWSFAFFFSVMLAQSLASYAYEVDKTGNVVTVSPGTTPAATTTDVKNAMNFLVNRADKDTLWTMKFAPGKYYLTSQVSASGLKNTDLISSDASNPAKLIKNPGWDSATSAEYLLYFRLGEKIKLTNLEFYGQTDFAKNVDPYWPDQGVYFGSCNIVRVDSNKFYNFGNAALRVVTDARDPVAGVNSFKTMVVNNLFNNIYQTATTATDDIHGGTAQSTWLKNTFLNLRGSVKFASRTPGAQNIEFFSNVINGGDHFGLEINNYSNFNIMGNTIQNIKSVAINIYTAAGMKGFAWGDNFSLTKNTISNVGRGIRYSHEPYSDGFQNVPTNLVIEDNILSNVNDTANYVPAIWVTNGTVSGLSIKNNKLSNISNKQYIGIPTGLSNVLLDGNLVDGAVFNLK